MGGIVLSTVVFGDALPPDCVPQGLIIVDGFAVEITYREVPSTGYG